MFLILTETSDEDGSSDGSSTDSSEEKRPTRECVQLTRDQLRLALGYLEERPYMWSTRRYDYKIMKEATGLDRPCQKV